MYLTKKPLRIELKGYTGVCLMKSDWLNLLSKIYG